MTQIIRRKIRNHLKHELPHDATDQQITEADSHLTPTELDARAYSIKYVATRKKVENEEKLEIQNRLEDAVRLLDLDRGQDKNYTNELKNNINTLKDTIQARNDYEEEENARKYIAEKNLEAETPTKAL